MKHLLPLITLASFSTLRAQPVLDFSNSGTVVGDAFTYHAGPWADPGTAGANQTWDLSTLTSDSLIFIEFVDPATTPDGASFPAATVAAMDMGFFAYSQFDATGGYLHGMSNVPGEAPIVYSDAMQMTSYPSTIGTTWVDAFHAEFSVMGFPIVRDGSITANADGYGTLILPWGTLNDVLRVTYVEDYADVTLATMEYHREYTYFLQAGTHYPIVHLFSFSSTVFGNTTIVTGSQWMVAGSVEVAEAPPPAPQVGAWFDPGAGVIEVIADGTIGPATVEVLDLSGAIVARHALTGGAGGKRIPATGLSGGLYLIRLTDASTARTARVVVP